MMIFVLIGTLVLGFSYALNPLDTAHLHNVELVDLNKVDIARTGKSLNDICQFNGNNGVLQFVNQSTVPADWSVIEFKLKLRSNETVFKVEIFNETDANHDDETKSHKLAITPALVTGPMDMIGFIMADYDSHLHQLNISLNEEQIGFAVWDITVNHKISITTKQVHLRDNFPGAQAFITEPSYGSQVYLVNSSTGNRAYMNFSLDDPDSSKEYCFALILSKQTPIEVYLSAFGTKQTNKLTRLEFANLDTNFCLSQYVYASQLGKFELSIVFDEGALIVYFATIRLDKANVHITKYPPVYSDIVPTDGSVGWLYNIPNGDYTVVADCKATLYACDILANCYPYERKVQNHTKSKHNETLYDFTLSKQYKTLLDHSPLIRLYSDDHLYTVHRSTPYLSANKISLNRIESHLRAATSPKTQSLQTTVLGIYYQIQATRKARIKLEIPIDTIDVRAQAIHTDFIEYNEVHLVGVKVNGVNKLDSNHTTNSTLSRGVSTADYIHVAPWQMASDHQVKSFGIEFEVVQSQSVNETQPIDLIIQIAVYPYEKTFHPTTTPLGIENCQKGPTYGDLDCHYEVYKCPDYYFKYDSVKKTCTRTDVPIL